VLVAACDPSAPSLALAPALTPQALEDGGTLLQVGCGKPDITVPLMSMGFREINIVTSFRYRLSWPVVIRLVADGIFGDVSRMITHTLPLERTLEAFETCADRSKLAIKVQVGGGRAHGEGEARMRWRETAS
jgi:L-iditol 2-dehydrogenase